jgi:hypothetical protein
MMILSLPLRRLVNREGLHLDSGGGGETEDVEHHGGIGCYVVHDPDSVGPAQAEPAGHDLPMHQPVIDAVHHNFRHSLSPSEREMRDEK